MSVKWSSVWIPLPIELKNNICTIKTIDNWNRYHALKVKTNNYADKYIK